MSQRQRSFVFKLSHDTFDQRGFTFTVSSHKSHFVATLHHKRSILEHHMSVIRLTHSVHGHRITARTWRGREFQAQARSIFFVHFHQFQFFKHTHTALYLVCFGISALESLDIQFRFSNHLLLIVILFLLLLATFLTQFEILRISRLIVVDTSQRYLNRAGRDVVHKLTVVTDHHHRFTRSHNEVFQPTNTLYVQVVGRLIEQEHIRILQK